MNEKNKKTILRKIPSGLYIVSSMSDGNPMAAVISFLTQSSISPPLITMALRKDSEIYKSVYKTRKCAIHFPAKDQQQLTASLFKIKTKDLKQINGHSYKKSSNGNPIFDEIPMLIEVEVIKISEVGDHHVFICEVISSVVHQDVEALLLSHTKWKYGG